MDLTIEVSSPGATIDPLLAPPINSRSAQTIVSVQSGETMIIGGLITENKARSSSGIPFLSQIPVIGGLFGTQGMTNTRSELVIFITPRVVNNEIDAQNVMNELRRKMDVMESDYPGFRAGTVPGAKPRPASQPPDP